MLDVVVPVGSVYYEMYLTSYICKSGLLFSISTARDDVIVVALSRVGCV